LRHGLLDKYSVGESPAASFKLCGAPLPNPAATTLIERIGGRYVLTVPACFTVQLALEGRSLAAAHTVELTPGLQATLAYGELRFYISLVEPEAVLARRRGLDRGFWASVVGVASLAVLAALLLRATPADGMSLALDDDAAAARLASYFEVDQPREQESDEPADSGAAETPTPPTHERERDTPAPGKTNTTTTRVPGPRGPSRAGPGLQRNFDPIAEAQHAGILGLLAGREQTFLASAEGAFGSSDADTRMWANASGLAGHGIAGLDLTSPGRSVGGTATGVSDFNVPGLPGGHGLGRGRPTRKSLLGHGSGSGDVPGAATPRYPGRQRKVPTATMCKLGIDGAMDKDVIRRIVRSHLNEVRSCYNAGLTRNPTLAGSVTVQFSIIRGGRVATAVISENTTHDTELGACITQAAKRWSFPAPPGAGTTLVTYPFTLRSH
jgi:TonB family protein